jgi:hypothetical protein
MSNPREHAVRTSSVVWLPLFVFVLAICILALTLVARLAVANQEGMSALDVALLLAIVIGVPVAIAAVTLMFYIVRTERRTAALRSADPEAFIAQIVTSPSAVRPLDHYANEVNGRPTRVGPSSYLTLVVDEVSIRIFSGSSKPHELASFPTPTLVRAELGTEIIGVRIVPCIALQLKDGPHSARISIVLFSFIHGIPRCVRGNALNAALEDFRRASTTGSQTDPRASQ